MKSKNELIKLLESKLKNNKINSSLAKALNEELLKKNINPNLTGLLFNGMKDIIDLNDNELILLTKLKSYTHLSTGALSKLPKLYISQLGLSSSYFP